MKLTNLALLASVFLLAACSPARPPLEPVRAVKVLTVNPDAFVSVHEYAGEVRAQVESRLSFRVGGKIIKRQAELGQRVKAGQLLAQLDPLDYKLAADAGRAQLQAAAVNRDLAAADFRRYKELKEQNFISGAELDRRETTLKAAQAQLEQAQSQLAVQGNQAGYTALVADVAGVVTAIDADVGQVVAAGTPVVRIAADGPRDVVFAVPEDKLATIKLGMSVTVRGWAQEARFAAKVRELAASADSITRTYQVKAAIDAKDSAPPLGATVYAVLQGLAAGGAQGLQVIKLPTSALRQDGKTSAVWVLDEASMTVRSQNVQIATADGNDAVIAAGLQPGMRVVIAGVHVLSPGQKVTIYQQKATVATVNTAQSAINTEANSAPAMRPPATPPAPLALTAPIPLAASAPVITAPVR